MWKQIVIEYTYDLKYTLWCFIYLYRFLKSNYLCVFTAYTQQTKDAHPPFVQTFNQVNTISLWFILLSLLTQDDSPDFMDICE